MAFEIVIDENKDPTLKIVSEDDSLVQFSSQDVAEAGSCHYHTF